MINKPFKATGINNKPFEYLPGLVARANETKGRRIPLYQSPNKKQYTLLDEDATRAIVEAALRAAKWTGRPVAQLGFIRFIG